MMTKDEAIVKNGEPAMGPVESAYHTVAFEKNSLGFYNHAVRGLLTSGIKVTAEKDLEKLKKLRGQGWQYMHHGTYFGAKAYEGMMTNCFDVDALFDFWKKNGIDPWLKSGRGLSKTCIKYLSRMPIDIDDGPMGAIPTLEQCRIMDAAIADGIQLSDVVTTGDDRPAPLSPFDPSTCQKGKGVHAGINFQPSTDFDLYDRTVHMLIAYFDSDTACADPGRRMRAGGLIAKYADKEERPHRIHTLMDANKALPTLQEVHDVLAAACARKGITDPEADFEALKFCVTFKGVITKLTRRAGTAAEMAVSDPSRSQYHLDNAARLHALAERCTQLLYDTRVGRRISDEARSLNTTYNKMDSDYDPKPVRTRPLSAQPGATKTSGHASKASSTTRGVIQPTYNPEAVYAGADTAPWDFENTVWMIRVNGVVHEGTASELYKAFGNTGRRIVSNVLCPYCGKDQRPEEAKPSGMLSMHSDMKGATAKCHSCGTLVKSSRSKKSVKSTYVPALERLLNATTWSHQTDLTGQKYVPADLELKAHVVMMSVPHGMGKTEFVLRRAEANPTRKMLYIVPTMNLADSGYGRLAAYGFQLYSDESMKGTITADRLVCCVDSIPRIDNSVGFDDVYLEEAHSTLRRFNDDGMRSRDVVWDHLRWHASTCERFVMLDGCLTDVDCEAAFELAGTHDAHVVYGKVDRKLTITVHNQFVDAHEWYKTVEGKAPMFVYSNTLADAMTFGTLSDVEKKLVVSSKTSGEDEVISLMRSPNTECTRLDLLIGTPSMGNGVDISVPHFKHNLILAQSGTFTDPEAVVQGLWRDRVCADKHLWVSDRGVGANESVDYWMDRLSTNSQLEIERTVRECGNSVVFFPLSSRATLTGMNRIRALMYVEQAIGQNNLREHVYGMLRDQGVKLRMAKGMSKKAAKSAQKAYSNTKKTVKMAECAAVSSAEIISIDEAHKLEKKRRASQEDRRKTYRARVADLVGDFPVTPELVHEYECADLKSRIYLYTAVTTILEGNGECFAGARLLSYSDDTTRAEHNSVSQAFLVAKILRDVGGLSASDLKTPICVQSSNTTKLNTKRSPRSFPLNYIDRRILRGDLQTLSGTASSVHGECTSNAGRRELVDPSKLPRAWRISNVDSSRVQRLKDIVSGADRVEKLFLREKAVDQPMLQVRDCLKSLGLEVRTYRHRENGVDVYDLAVDVQSIARMSRMTAKARADLLPLKDAFDSVSYLVEAPDEWPDDSEYEAAATF